MFLFIYFVNYYYFEFWRIVKSLLKYEDNDLTFFSTVFQLYQVYGKVIITAVRNGIRFKTERFQSQAETTPRSLELQGFLKQNSSQEQEATNIRKILFDLITYSSL